MTPTSGILPKSSTSAVCGACTNWCPARSYSVHQLARCKGAIDGFVVRPGFFDCSACSCKFGGLQAHKRDHAASYCSGAVCRRFVRYAAQALLLMVWSEPKGHRRSAFKAVTVACVLQPGLHELSHKKKARFWRELLASFPRMIDFLCNPKQLKQVHSIPAISMPCTFERWNVGVGA